MSYKIEPTDWLLRRIPNKPNFFVNGRITSACFKTHTGEDGLSVDIEKLVEDIREKYNPATHSLGEILAKLPMDEGYECRHDPIEGNSSHALIVGDTRKIAKKLARSCKLINPLE